MSAEWPLKLMIDGVTVGEITRVRREIDEECIPTYGGGAGVRESQAMYLNGRGDCPAVNMIDSRWHHFVVLRNDTIAHMLTAVVRSWQADSYGEWEMTLEAGHR